MMDVGAACLDRDGDAERVAEPDRGRAIWPEELRIDHVEREIRPQRAEQREQRAGEQHGAERRTGAGNHGEAGAVDRQAVPHLVSRQGGQRGIARMAGEQRRDADGRDDADRDAGARGERLRLAFDETAEGGPAGIGKQGGQRQDSQHGRIMPWQVLTKRKS